MFLFVSPLAICLVCCFRVTSRNLSRVALFSCYPLGICLMRDVFMMPVCLTLCRYDACLSHVLFQISAYINNHINWEDCFALRLKLGPGGKFAFKFIEKADVGDDRIGVSVLGHFRCAYFSSIQPFLLFSTRVRILYRVLCCSFLRSASLPVLYSSNAYFCFPFQHACGFCRIPCSLLFLFALLYSS